MNVIFKFSPKNYILFCSNELPTYELIRKSASFLIAIDENEPMQNNLKDLK